MRSNTVVDTNEALAAFEAMLEIRLFEEKVLELHASGRGPGTCTSVGQEASAVGVVRALDVRDRVLTNHRSAGHLLARGADPGRLLAEILGKEAGYCRGRSGSLHVSARELGVVLTSTIVGGELSLAPGVALALAAHDERAIAVCFFGDGAACEGVFHESLNLAAVWQLPVLYVCENNQWQAYVHRRETMLVDRVAEWAGRYGMPSESVDGNDWEAVTRAARRAVDFVRGERRPFFLETYTYRLRGHFEPDTQEYVEPTELAAWRARDPLALLERRLVHEGALDREKLAAIQARAAARIAAAAEFALAAPYPSVESLTDGVYA